MVPEADRVAAELHEGAMQEVTLARLQLDLLCASVTDNRLAADLGRISDILGEAGEQLQQLQRGLVARVWAGGVTRG